MENVRAGREEARLTQEQAGIEAKAAEMLAEVSIEQNDEWRDCLGF